MAFKWLTEFKNFINVLFFTKPVTLEDCSVFGDDAEEAFKLCELLRKNQLTPDLRERFNALQIKHLNDIVL